MIIINEDALIHTDSSSDIIQHFGVKGMRWGQRRVISNRGAARAQKKIKKLNKRLTDTMGNRFKNELSVAVRFGNALDGHYRHIENARKLEKNQAKLLSNKKNISYKDALKEVRKPIYGEAYKSQERYEKSKEKYGKKDPRTKRDKAVWDSNHSLASFQDQVKKSGHYAHESTITNGYINKLYNDGVRSSQKAQRFNALAKQAGLKG